MVMKNEEVFLKKRIAELEQMLQYYQDYDSLTGVFNKDAFYVRMRTILERYPKQQFQVIRLDIEHFKLVNDLFGIHHGDQLLRELADHLKKLLTDEEKTCIARMNADRFLVFMPVEGSQEIIEQMQHLLDHCILDMDIVIAIGIYIIEDRSISVRLMCDRSGIAANAIKGDYHRHIEYFKDEMRNVLIEEQELLHGVETSLLNGEFEVFIQPKCNMQTKKIYGGEALVRWNHPTKGMIPPKDFIPIFEKNGFIKQLDVYVWEQTAKWLHDWIEEGHQAIPISVNVSRIDIINLDVLQIFDQLIKRHGLEPSLLELEITESAYSSRSDEIIYVVNEIMKNGFTVLMDDFGSGYSSLNLLKDISIDVLKLDMRFLDKDNKKSKDILESVVHMAKWLNLKIVAEGVENAQQVDFLLGIGVRFAQGFYYYRPLPLQAFAQLLMDKNKVEFPTTVQQNRMEWVRFKDLMHEDIISEQMLNNILGAVSVYALQGDEITILRGNEAYFKLIDVQNFLTPYHHNLREVMSWQDYQRMLQTMKQARESRDHGCEVIVKRYCEDHQSVSLQIKFFYLSEANDSYIYYASLHDVTTLMNALEERHMSEKQFEIAMQAMNESIFEVDVKTRTVTYHKSDEEGNKIATSIANAPEGVLATGLICPESRAAFCAAYEDIYQGKTTSRKQVKLYLKNGEKCWCHLSLTAIQDTTGKTVRAIGHVQPLKDSTAVCKEDDHHL